MKKITLNQHIIFGIDIQPQTQCVHYHSTLDVIAIQLRCCLDYYACFYCHQEMTSHPVMRWQKADFDQKAIIGGCCGNQLSIANYLVSQQCPNCKQAFNLNCKKHWSLYFNLPLII